MDQSEVTGRHSRIIGVVLFLGLYANAQGGDVQQFHWNWHDAQELDLKHTVGTSTELSPEEKQQLTKAISLSLRKTAGAGADTNALAKTRIRLIDLNGDGIPEVIAQPTGTQAGCGATGNCPLWIFEKDSPGYQVILDSGAQQFNIEKASSDGFRNVVLVAHDSASEQTLYVFRFKSDQYHRTACYKANWWAADAWLKLPEPRLMPCSKK